MDNEFEPDPLIRQLEELAADSPFPIEAYQFAMEAAFAYWRTWETYGQLLNEEFFCDFVNDYSLKRFGANTRPELQNRSICSGNDFGEIYTRLVQAEIIPGDSDDLIEYFENGLAFDDAFTKFRRPELFGNYFQWRVSTLFFVTTLAAVAVVGANNLGVKGGVATLFAVWIAGIGLFSLILGSRKRSKGWQLNVVGGLVLLAIGVSLFYILVA